MIKNYKIILQYDGTRYDGWQKQGNTDSTIQGKLEAVLLKMTGSPTEVHGSGRTDAGVHARGQAANFKVDLESDEDQIMEYLNRYLPEDIAVLDIRKVPARFHSRLNAMEKTYLYQIETSLKKDVFERKFVYGLGEKLDIDKMRQAAGCLIGTHDFRSFCSNKNLKKSSVRTINSIQIDLSGSKVLIRYIGNGFLHNMVRILTGTLIEIGLGKRSPIDMPGILKAQNRQAAGFTAPPEGLILESVQY